MDCDICRQKRDLQGSGRHIKLERDARTVHRGAHPIVLHRQHVFGVDFKYAIVAASKSSPLG